MMLSKRTRDKPIYRKFHLNFSLYYSEDHCKIQSQLLEVFKTQLDKALSHQLLLALLEKRLQKTTCRVPTCLKDYALTESNYF